MTDKSTERGEGVKGLAKAILAYDEEFMTVLVSGRSVVQEKADYAWAAIIKRATLLETSLEAAAPAGTAPNTPEQNESVRQLFRDVADYLDGDDKALAGRCKNTAELLRKISEVRPWAALATPSPQAGNGMVRRCMARNSETGQCELREGHATKHLAGMLMWGEAIEDATNPVADPEYVRTMEAPAATQEPAGSALLCPRCGCASKDNPFDQRRRLCLTCCTGFDIADAADPGSPRKVGEDGARGYTALDGRPPIDEHGHEEL